MNDSKKIIISIIVVTLIVFSVDLSVGKSLDKMISKIGVKDPIGKLDFAINKIKSPVLIIGSSRASHHYVTKIIADSLREDVYNLGLDGCFFSHNCATINSILDRYSPKLIIWEFSPSYLEEKGNDPLCDLYQYYGKFPYITNLINEEVTWTEEVRLRSCLYKYNSKIPKILLSYIRKESYTDDLYGYLPIYSKGMQTTLNKEDRRISSLCNSKITRFKKTINRLKSQNVELIVVDSPKFLVNTNKESLKFFEKMCDSLNVNFIDNSHIDIFLKHSEYFKDRVHLNDKGAKHYTKYFLKQLLEKENILSNL